VNVHPLLSADVAVPTSFMVVAMIAIVAQAIVLLVALFQRGLRYKIDQPELQDMDERQFLHTLQAVTDARLSQDTGLDVFTNGEQYYEAELEAIRAARQTVHLEAYIFQRGQVADRFVRALEERARAGVEVRLVLDGVGSVGATRRYLAPLLDAGGKVAFYHALRFSALPHYNNRTHRELIVVDGTTAFVGGSGVADHWLVSTEQRRRWRDTMVRVRGSAVNHLQATFAENWLEASGELLVGEKHFPAIQGGGHSPALVVLSTPSAGGSTRARILFQMLLASARKSIHITTPYFLPDPSICDELKKAVRRGAEVKVLVPGKHSDHLLTRSSSRLSYGRLMPHGVRIFEYAPAMIHAKILIVDGEWSVVGSTNFDNRSFGLNDEVNVAVCDRDFAARLEADFKRDVAEAHEVMYEAWKRRGLFARAPELVGWVLERQQ
jgi:cardiolipin synthase